MKQNKKIILAISGGISAYKSLELIRLLKKNHFAVKVIMTQNATKFVSPLTCQALSGSDVGVSLFDDNTNIEHIEYAKWADLIIVAPSTANIIGKIAHGIADDLLTNIILATNATILMAPAMNKNMYSNLSVQHNIKILKDRNINIIEPFIGEQACGDVGPGRLADIDYIFNRIVSTFSPKDCKNLKITITAGPTRENIDPVRYISNYSSGKMGFALAEAFAERGAQVTLITGPVSLKATSNITRIDVISALEMHAISLKKAKEDNIFIGCAAVADYRAEQMHTEKVKKSNETIELKLIKNPDIITDVANLTHHRPFVIGFAAETNDLMAYAKNKLSSKNLDLICANDVSSKELGFNSDNNELHIYDRNNNYWLLPKTDKNTLSVQLIDIILQQYNNHTTNR